MNEKRNHPFITAGELREALEGFPASAKLKLSIYGCRDVLPDVNLTILGVTGDAGTATLDISTDFEEFWNEMGELEETYRIDGKSYAVHGYGRRDDGTYERYELSYDDEDAGCYMPIAGGERLTDVPSTEEVRALVSKPV